MNDRDVSPEDVTNALNRILISPSFKEAERLKSFLQYVVTETLEGRERQLLGKNIVSDVYGRTSDHDATTVNVVRVDAGRLRRRLDSYYANEGAGDAVRITVPKGGYAPVFEYASDNKSSQPAPPLERPQNFKISLWSFGAGMAATVVAVLIYSFLNAPSVATDDDTRSGQPQEQLERAILFDVSPSGLQARNIADEARGMFFPATQPRRLQATLLLFEAAIELDPTYFGGYSGAAQATSMLGGLSPLGPQRDQMLKQSQAFVDEAMKLAPSESWSHSSAALLLMFKRDFDQAVKRSQQAVSLDPSDLSALEFDAIIAFFSGDFARALESSAPDIHQARSGRFPWRSVFGNASFYVGEYEDAVQYLLEAAALGEPVSEVSSVHLIASLQASGRSTEAAERLREFKDTWPESRVLGVLTQLFKNQEDVERLLDQLVAAGWNS
ncbi:tetratricopeptide repeat protein [Shimia sp. MIT1388]|uniref:tetratricopeptide repeat protein n=1 Tax=Shimia sp. MIT1388 TaxID=3096992 RepID=UPI00399B259B